MNRKQFIAAMLLCCYLGVHGGNLAIWRGGHAEPELVLPYDISIFPVEDQSRLLDGIPFSNQEELSRLLEDFAS